MTSETSSDGNVTLTTPSSGYVTGYSPGTGNEPTATTISANYAYILDNWIYNSSSSTLGLSLNNLTPNQTYQVEIWVNDSRNAGDVFNRMETATGGANASGALDYNYTYQNGGGAQGGAGEYVIGTFVADATGTQAITLTPTGSASQSAQIDALELVSVPEPISAAGVLGLLAFTALGRRRRATA